MLEREEEQEHVCVRACVRNKPASLLLPENGWWLSMKRTKRRSWSIRPPRCRSIELPRKFFEEWMAAQYYYHDPTRR